MKTETHLSGRPGARTTFRSAVLALLAIGATSWSSAQAPPAASPVITQTSVVVRLSDLDLSTGQGAHAAYERIRTAAKRACKFTTDMGDYVIGGRKAYLGCYRDTMARTIEHLHRTQLAAMHDQLSRTGGY